MTTDAVIKEVIKVDTKIAPPVDYNVIYENDEVTTRDFVIETLVLVFNHDQTTAESMTEKVHVEGKAVVATLPYEIAEQKCVEVTVLARNNGFPLSVKLEPNS